ncbi:MerR family transcriptional regulator [Streptomyces varsoviensis]|uniref:MerR family transcriptional regulator n=1 Tax=Streptomyces varsoviensis TaxID=67373 RepID=UPI0007C54B69|nr:MerR family transcriptional regulator [Streptomyces varsoviensis]
MRIGDAAAAAGLTPRALRYYEQQGLLAARRTPSGHRVYGPEDVRRLRVVRGLLGAGLTVGDVRSFAEGLDKVPAEGLDTPPAGAEGDERFFAATGADACPAAAEVIRHRLADLDARIAQLMELRRRLAEQVGEETVTPGAPGAGPGVSSGGTPGAGSRGGPKGGAGASPGAAGGSPGAASPTRGQRVSPRLKTSSVCSMSPVRSS